MTALYLLNGSRVLLLYKTNGRVVTDTWCAAAGGHLEPEELTTPEVCVLRELKEETGLTPDDLEGLSLRYVTLRFVNGEIRQNYYSFAALRSPDRPLSSTEGTLRWFEIGETDRLAMPFSASFVLRHYFSEGCRTDLLYGGISDGDGVVFTPLR